MKVKQVLYIPIKHPLLPQTEEVMSETIIEVENLVVIMWDSFGLFVYYKNMAHYLERRFKYVVEDIDTNVMIIDIGEC
jgi:hypothetical protein